MTLATITRPATLPRLGELPQTLTLEVTQLDVFFGLRESGNQCPIACAFKRTLEALGLDVLTVDVDNQRADVWLRGDSAIASDAPWISFRHNAESFVRLFDDGQRVKPCTVTLRRVDR